MKRGKEAIKRQLQFSFALQNQIKLNYNLGSDLKKTTISRSVAGNVIKKYQLMGHLSKLVSLKRYQYNLMKPGLVPSTQVRNKDKVESLKEEITNFFVIMKIPLNRLIRMIF